MNSDQSKQKVEHDDKPNTGLFRYFENTNTAKTHHFYLTQALGSPEEYVDMIHQLKTCGVNDIAYIYLNTPGGYVTTGIQIINAMRNCPAKVVTVLESEAHSMGTFIFLAGDEFVVHDNCRMMFHNFSSGMYGKGNELGQQLESTLQWFNDLANDYYIPFLSVEEVARIMKGEDLWICSADIRTRLIKMAEMVQAEMAMHIENEADQLRAEAKRLINEANLISPPKPKKVAVKPKPKTKAKTKKAS